MNHIKLENHFTEAIQIPRKQKNTMLLDSTSSKIIIWSTTLALSNFADGGDLEIDLTPLQQALEIRDEYTSVVSNVSQEKVLPSLVEPVVTAGKLWLIPQTAFRWEQGDPRSQIALFSNNEVKLIDEKTNTVELFDPKSRSIRPLMLLLGMGDDATFDGLIDNFDPVSSEKNGNTYSVSFIPDSGLMKRAVKELTLVIDLTTSFPQTIIWEQKDGAIVTTRFEAPEFNVTVASELFTFTEETYVEK